MTLGEQQLYLEIGRERVAVTLSYRDVRNINLYVKAPDGHVLVTAPRAVPVGVVTDFLHKKEAWIAQARTRMQRGTPVSLPAATGQERSALLDRVREMATYWAARMQVHPAGFAIRRMKSRWGSCSVSAGTIRISEALAHYPETCLEYVVVHELCHLLEPSHNARFKALMTRFLPDWKARKELLNRSPDVE